MLRRLGGLHLLLLLILLVGPAFLASKSKSDNSPILDVIPGKLIDAAFSGGGNPNGDTAAARPARATRAAGCATCPSAAADKVQAPEPHPGTRQRGQADQARPECAGAEQRPQAEEARTSPPRQ